MDGLTPAAGRLHGVTRQSAATWSRAVEASGVVAIRPQKRGPKVRPRLEAEHERAIRRAIRQDCPDQMLLPLPTGGTART